MSVIVLRIIFAFGYYVEQKVLEPITQRAIAAKTPFAWVAADSVYGVGELETALRKAGKGYVLGVTGKHHFCSWGNAPVVGTADKIAATLQTSDWKRLSAGEGTKGTRLHD